MKYLKTYNESLEDDKLDILDNFAHISDKIGDPFITSHKYGDDMKWIITWKIGTDLSVLQEANDLIPKLKIIVEDIDDILSAGDRLSKYNINMSLTNELRLELVPKESGSDKFKFIREHRTRVLYVNINEIERFFNSRGVRILDYDCDSSYNEYNGTNHLEISVSKNTANNEFFTLMMAELNIIRNENDERYQVRTEGSLCIIIYPENEKSYVEVVRGTIF